ncbi:DUF3108 domain-containing protein [Desulfopila sp. IMCC35008]|uniref:DUF3108 domain-containing protein n=1 Tax=Desulfopila sp. IMCC35008 TaxID=2653858 RepID=UPI0013CFA97A|nr:DUF3108 domain-containing protein [Desulfopila sp. IMCC35008]
MNTGQRICVPSGLKVVFCSCLFLITLILHCLGIPTLVHADSSTRSSTADLSLLPEFQPEPGVYYYDVFINGMRVGKVTIKTVPDGDTYTIEVKGKTRKAISSLYKVQYKGEVKMQPDPIRPLSATIKQRSGTKIRDVSMMFPSEKKVIVSQQDLKAGEESTVKEYSLESDSFILDPFSTLFLVRALDWEVGMAEIFHVFTGKKTYELKLLCNETSRLATDGVKRDVWVIRPQVTTLTEPFETRLAGYEVLLSRDERREILMIKGKANVGKLVARMRKFTPLPGH